MMNRAPLVALVSLLVSTTAIGQVTVNVLERVKRFRHGPILGSAFTIQVAGRQYVITARHNLNGKEETAAFDLFLDGQWRPFLARVVYPSNDAVDIVALEVATSVTPDYPLEATTRGLALGQPVYFLGYPLGLATRGGLRAIGSEVPFIKAGVMSAMDSRQSDAKVLYIDGHNNPGFSGGPIVFKEPGSREFRVAGVVQAYRYEDVPVLKRAHLTDPTTVAFDDLYVRANTGILIGFDIGHIVDAIERAGPPLLPAPPSAAPPSSSTAGTSGTSGS